MKFRDKQLKYSIRKFSVGVASVAIGAVYLAMGTHVAHAGEITPNSEQHDRVTGTGKPDSNPSETETKTVTRTIKYVNAADESKEVSTTVTQTVTLTRKQGTKEWTTGKWEAQTSPIVDGYSAPNQSTVEAKEVTSTTEDEEVIVYYTKLGASSTSSTRGRRVRRETGDAPTGETSGNSTGTENNEAINSALTERKGSTVQADQPGINIPKGNEPGAQDPNAHISFDDPNHTATVEEMWKIIQNMPDDFQNNERSYLRNMDTLGNELRFDKTDENPEGVPLKPGEIREISNFGGWTAIMKKDGETGKFAIGMKNEQGYFTGWYNKNGERQEGGMLGSDALDRIYLHEQALDRRFKYMLMLAKGRTIANKDDKAQDGSAFDIVTANSAENKAKLASLPVKDREDILQHAPNIEGFNGIEKTFTAFSTAYGSRLKIEFVTGYISDFEGSKGTYRIVVKAIKKDNSEETVYDHTINRIDGVVENEERYSQGVDLSGFNNTIKSLLKNEYNKKVTDLANAKYTVKYPGRGKKDREKLDALKEEVKQELAKSGDVIYELPIDKDELHEVEKNGKPSNKFKEGIPFIAKSYAAVANDLNNSFSKKLDREVQKNSPAWISSAETNPDGTVKSKDPDRVYKLLDFILPTAKKIVYHADTDQLELQTDPDKVAKHREELKNRLAAKKVELETANEEKKIELKKEISALESAIGSTNAYTYTEARNGSKEAKILGSHMEATRKTDEISDPEYGKYHTNELAEKESDGLAKFTRYFVEKENVARSNVISDEKLSEIINTEISGDNDKLGKGGYFSTGDIPLGKDVVSYKVQVFAENEKRVGVNKQSPRLQYNLPILADFSVIQDTVEPSKELARRIISKSNLPEDKKKEIIEKINKSKKTSEIRSQLSGDVKVKYQDVSGNVLTLDNTKEHQKETDLGKKGEDGTYLAVDSGLRYTNYNVTDKKLNTITTSDGKQYILKRSLEDGTLDNGRLKTSADESGTLSDSLATVTFVYEEYTPPATGKGVVHFKKQVSETTTEALTGYDDITLSGNVGETFSSTDVDTRITALKNAGYEIVEDTFTNGDKIIDSTADVDGQDPSQVYNVIVREKVETVTTPPTPNTPVDPNNEEGPKWPETGLAKSDLEKEVTRTITYVKKETADGEKIPDARPTKVDKVLYKRTATYNLVSKTVTYSNWTPTADDTHTATSFSPVKTPVLTGYVADFKEVTDAPAAPTANGEVTNMTKEVVYTKIGSWVPKIPGKTPIPIPYPNDPEDATKPKYPDYPKTPENPDGTPNPQPENPGGSTPGGNETPGGETPGGGNETPGGETPGGGNENPGGETPGTPEKPKTPELPVIPYEPGYTPGIPTDPTQPVDPKTNPLVPLTLVDPKDPKKGYKVPEIPETPGNDTPITYEANPQKALVKVVNVKGEGE
uniref:mucin-binding protein n=1 Tax=uncultured Granulicatella sp. TaxID=316089 RepID=UPI0028D359E4